jgi:hypothetical protein
MSYRQFQYPKIMKRTIRLLAPIVLIIVISCNPLKDVSLNSITTLYDGKISIAKGMRASTSQGKDNYLKLSVEENKFIASGWLLPEAMASNCAMLLLKENPNIYDKVDLLQIEIINTTTNLFEYRKQDLNNKSPDYNKVERNLNDFVETLDANKIEDAMRFMKSNSNTNMNDLAAFMKSVKSVLPTRPRATKLIGYREVHQSEKIYEVDFVVISQDDVQRMLKATLEENENGLRFLNITI